MKTDNSIRSSFSLRWQLLIVLAWVAIMSAACSERFEATTAAQATPRETSNWREYGGGNGQRYVDAGLIDRNNVGDLRVAWVYRTGHVASADSAEAETTSAFQLTPILAQGRLLLCTPFNDVIALDPVTGGELWRYHHKLELNAKYSNQMNCRGVSYWSASGARGHCEARVFSATNDGWLIALDASSGKPCASFGDNGRVNLRRGVGAQEYLGEYQQTSPPAIVGNHVVVGAAVADNRRIDAPSGVVRAFDARSGEQVWAFDLAPPDFDYAHGLVSDEGYALGTPNVWGPMAVDEQRGWVYVPTGNPAPDYYRSGEPDMDYYGSGVVALNGETGRVLWHFNTVINDFWDYDVGAQPTLLDLEIDGEMTPLVIVSTKMGFVFVLNRHTGEPVVPVSYQSVPRYGPLQEQLSPVQPFPPAAFRVSPEFSAAQVWGLTPFDKGNCREQLEALRSGPIYTPIGEQWTVVAPSNLGGINWGGVAVDPRRGRIYARSSNVPYLIKLVPREQNGGLPAFVPGTEVAEQRGLPYGMARKPWLSNLGLPCNQPPWGYLSAIDIAGQKRLWHIPHGTVRDIAPLPLPIGLGVPGLGAPIVTRTGLLFIGAAWENVLRAYDADTGKELWKHDLPASPQATPMSYSATSAQGDVQQFVLIAAGGHGKMGSTMGDYLVAFKLAD